MCRDAISFIRIGARTKVTLSGSVVDYGDTVLSFVLFLVTFLSLFSCKGNTFTLAAREAGVELAHFGTPFHSLHALNILNMVLQGPIAILITYDNFLASLEGTLVVWLVLKLIEMIDYLFLLFLCICYPALLQPPVVSRQLT